VLELDIESVVGPRLDDKLGLWDNVDNLRTQDRRDVIEPFLSNPIGSWSNC
jgi:hypothetical protein